VPCAMFGVAKYTAEQFSEFQRKSLMGG
jgi:hypothetical protein